MIETIAQTVVRNLVDKNLVLKEDKEIYEYGIKQFLDFLINIVSVGVIGVLFGMIWQSMIFSVAYIPLRRYGGGYHASTPQLCYILSLVLISTSLIIIKYMDINCYIMLVGLICSVILFFLKSPVESKNNLLSKSEINTYRRRVFIILSLESLFTIASAYLEWEMVHKCTWVAICMASALLVFSDNKKESLVKRTKCKLNLLIVRNK